MTHESFSCATGHKHHRATSLKVPNFSYWSSVRQIIWIWHVQKCTFVNRYAGKRRDCGSPNTNGHQNNPKCARSVSAWWNRNAGVMVVDVDRLISLCVVWLVKNEERHWHWHNLLDPLNPPLASVSSWLTGVVTNQTLSMFHKL